MSKRVDKEATLHDDNLSSMSIIELMHQIVGDPSPRLGDQFEEEAEEFVDACLMKDPDERHSPKTLLVRFIEFALSHMCRLTCLFSQEYRWMDDARDSTFDVKAWTATF